MREANAAVNRTATSGFIPLPTIPRTPETPAIKSFRWGTGTFLLRLRLFEQPDDAEYTT